MDKKEYLLSKINDATEKNDKITGSCPFPDHDDKHASFLYNLEADYWKCMACGKSGDSFEKLYAELEELDIELVKDAFNTRYEVEKNPKMSKVDVRTWNETLLSMPKLMQKLYEIKGWTEEIIKKYEIGFNLDRITIPIYNNSNRLVNVRFYSLTNQDVKTYSHKGNKTPLFIFPIDILKEHEEIFLCEGESDCLVGLSLGLPCITLTGGAENFDRKLLRYFKDKIVYIMYDNDSAGKNGAKRISGYLNKTAKEVFIVNLPVENEKEDLTDLVIKYNATKEDILNFTKSAEIDNYNEDNKTPIKLGLRQLGFHKYINQLVETSALVVGRETDTYVVPKRIELICPKGSMPKKCGICPFASEDDLNTIEINNITMIELMNKSENQHKNIIKKAENIPCNKFDYYVKDYLNLTELQLMPSLDNEETGIILYAITKEYNIETNFVYDFTGRVIVHPLEQLATFIIEKAELKQDDISGFEIDEKLKKEIIRILK